MYSGFLPENHRCVFHLGSPNDLVVGRLHRRSASQDLSGPDFSPQPSPGNTTVGPSSPWQSGWWLRKNPSEKYEFVNWDDEIPNIWKHKSHVPNHQPVSGSLIETIWLGKLGKLSGNLGKLFRVARVVCMLCIVHDNVFFLYSMCYR